MYRLETLGRLTLARTDGREPVPTLPRKALGLLAILAAGGPMSRDRLMALLWPESDLLHARGSLKKTIHQLAYVDGKGETKELVNCNGTLDYAKED